MVEFRKKSQPSADTMVSKYFSDMYDGGTTTAELLGGLKANKYLFQATVASKPTFGHSELKRLDFDFYVDSVSIGENTTKYPEAVSYLLKEGSSVTKGYASRVDADILAFSSVIDGYPSIADVFDGNADAGADAAKYSNIARTIKREDLPYTTVAKAEDKGQKGYKWRNGKDRHSMSEIRRDFGHTAEELGIKDVLGAGSTANYIPVERWSKESKYYSSDAKDEWHRCIPNAAHKGIGYEIWVQRENVTYANNDLSTTDGYGNEATPSNTIFEMVRGAGEFSEWDDTVSSAKLLGVGMPRFNTDNAIKGGQSLELFTYWTGASGDVDVPTYQGKSYATNSSYYDGGPSGRQECLLVKKNIPYPVIKPAKPSKERDGVQRIVNATIADNKLHAEGHGLSNGDIIFVADDSWGSLVGTESSNNWETRQTSGDYVGVFVRNANADDFQVARSNSNSTIYALSGGDNPSLKIKIVDQANEILGTGAPQLASQAVFDDYDASEHCSTIELDLCIKQLAKAFTWKTSNSGTHNKIYPINGDDGTATAQDNEQNFLTLRRGFHIVFATEPPEDDDTLYDYIARMSDLHDQSGVERDRIVAPGFSSLDGNTAEETYWSLQSSKSYNKQTTQNACFAAVSVLNTSHGLQIIPFNGVHGVSSNDSTNYATTGAYISDHDIRAGSAADLAHGDIVFREQLTATATNIDEIGATGRNHAVPIEDTWVRFTFAVDPSTSISKRQTLDTRGTFSFGRLFVSNLDDGKIIKVGSASSADGRDYLDIALFGDGGAHDDTSSGASPHFYSFNASEGDILAPSFVAGRKYKITSVDSGNADWSSWGGPSSAAVGNIFVASGAGTSNGNKAIDLTRDPSNWPKHMSIWLTNAATNVASQRDVLMTANADAQSKVLIDAVRFKDFNFDITNSSQLDAMRLTSPIKIEGGKGFNTPYGTQAAFFPGRGEGGDFMAGRYTSTPSLLTLGFTSRDYLSVNSVASGDQDNTWTDWPYGFWLNQFSADNLGKVGDIPDDHIKATVSMARYTTATADTVPLGHTYTQKGIDHQMYNNDYNAGTQISHNLYNAYDDGSYSGRSAFSTKWLNTGLRISANTCEGGAKQFVCVQNTNFGTSTPSPIRVGDKVRIQEHNQYRGGSTARQYEYTVASVTGATNGSTGAGVSLTFTVDEDPRTSGDGGEADTNNWAADYYVAVYTPTMCRNFSQKGGFQLYANSDEEFCATKRENIAASARVVEILEKSQEGVVIQVDTMAPFETDDDEEYVFYLHGENATFSDSSGVAIPDTIASDSANCKTGLKIVAKNTDNKTIVVDWNGKDNAGTTEILTYDNIHRLFVSPWRYWAHIMINVSDSNGLDLSGRRYGNIQLYNNNWTDSDSNKRSWFGEGLAFSTGNTFVNSAQTNRDGRGSTWNEFLFNDTSTGGVNGPYLNNWDLDISPKHSTIEADIDFGFGSYDESEREGGYTGKTLLIDSQYNRIKMPEVVKGGDIEPNDTVNFLIDYHDVGLSHKTVIRTTAHSTYKPYLYSVFEDKKPANPQLSVKPYEKDPFLPEFNWQASDDDLWYGILHIDSKSIDSQYHNGIFHMPMNESGAHGSTVSAAGDELFASNATTGSTSKTALFTYTGALVDAEGLAGNCVRFDGSDDRITYTASSNEAFPELDTAVASGGTGAASIVVHVTPDNGIDGTTNVIFDGKPFYISYDADNGKIQARCYTSATNYVALEGPDIITDGQTPTCIIVTIDNALKSGNCKLFINGAVVDQSGLISSSAPATDGTGRSWYNNSGTPAVPFVASTAVTVGAASNSFLGRIEELVIYKSCIYPVVPSNGKFVLDKALKEINNETPISYNARLFLKDYHNIRGTTTDEVAASSSVSYRKAAFRLKD